MTDWAKVRTLKRLRAIGNRNPSIIAVFDVRSIKRTPK